MSAKAPMARPTWIGPDSDSGMPTSREMTEASSSVRAARPSEIRARSLDLSAAGVADHAGKAAAAALTARSTSSGVPSGILPMTSSVVELMTSSVPVPVEATHTPSMYSLSRICMMPSLILALVAARGARAPLPRCYACTRA